MTKACNSLFEGTKRWVATANRTATTITAIIKALLFVPPLAKLSKFSAAKQDAPNKQFPLTDIFIFIINIEKG